MHNLKNVEAALLNSFLIIEKENHHKKGIFIRMSNVTI